VLPRERRNWWSVRTWICSSQKTVRLVLEWDVQEKCLVEGTGDRIGLFQTMSVPGQRKNLYPFVTFRRPDLGNMCGTAERLSNVGHRTASKKNELHEQLCIIWP
jgi:hypothetical protein